MSDLCWCTSIFFHLLSSFPFRCLFRLTSRDFFFSGGMTRNNIIRQYFFYFSGKKMLQLVENKAVLLYGATYFSLGKILFTGSRYYYDGKNTIRIMIDARSYLQNKCVSPCMSFWGVSLLILAENWWYFKLVFQNHVSVRT